MQDVRAKDVAERRDQKLRNSHKRCKAEGPNLDFGLNIHT